MEPSVMGDDARTGSAQAEREVRVAGPSREERFAGLLADNRDRIYRIVCCYIRDPEVRQDVYQDVLMGLWRALDSFEARSMLSTWVYRVALNTCLAHLRSAKRRAAVIDREASVDDAVADPEAGAQGESADIAHLYRCIHQLKDADRALLSLYLEDLDTREIAEVLGIPDGTVRVQLHRAKKTLQELWERLPYGT